MTVKKTTLLGTLLNPARWLDRRAAVTRQQAREAARRREWREFTLLLGAAFVQQGYEVRQLDDGQGVGGTELLLKKADRRYIVECEHWRTTAVTEHAVRDAIGRMLALRCAGAFLVTSGYFTADAGEYAAGRNVVLIEGPQLRQLLRRARKV